MKIIWLKDYPLLEDKVDRLISVHTKKGFGVVSACRRDKTNVENLKRTEQLKKDLSEMGWSYTIGYGGGFQKKGSEEGFDTSKPKFNEISIIVYNHNRKDGNKNLLKDLISLGRKYEQDDIYYQEPDGKAYWYDKNGNTKALEHRFTGIMEGINPPPTTLIEEIKRKKAGEIFISSTNVLTNEEEYNLLNQKYFDY